MKKTNGRLVKVGKVFFEIGKTRTALKKKEQNGYRVSITMNFIYHMTII